MRRAALAGASVIAVYVAVVAATNVFTSHDVRPLLDAIGPPPAYRWVKPPPDFAAGNLKPKVADVDFGLQPDDPPPGGASEDSQFVFSLPRDAIAPQGDARGVAHIAPFDPDKLGKLPAAKTFANGNAYRITFTYSTGGDATPTAVGSVLLTVPVPADDVYYSKDGLTWQKVKSQHASATSIGAELPGAGYYLATTPDVISSVKGSGGFAKLLLPILITVVVAAALIGVPVMLRRRRPTPAKRAAARRRQRQQRR